MRKTRIRHWTYLLTGPILALLLIGFWYFNQNYLSQTKSPVVLLLENPIFTFGLIIFGAFISAFICREYSIRTPVTYEPLIFALIGGVIMGVGAVIAAMSVHSVVLFNLSGIFNLTAFMITKGWIYAVFMILGGFIGSKILCYLTLRTRHLKKNFFIPKELMERKNQRIIFYICTSLFALFVLAIAIFSKLNTPERISFVFVMLFLVVFGVVVERGTICMSSMLKEWFIARSSYVWRTILFTIMCLALFYQVGLGLSLFQPIVLEGYIHNLDLLIAGSFLMGAGFIFADGCFIGSLWKAGQGNIINMIGIFGMLVGMGVSQAVLIMKVGEARALQSLIPNYLNSLMKPSLFLLILWLGGILFFTIFKLRRYRY